MNKKIMHGKVFERRKLSAQSRVPCNDEILAYSVRSKRRCLGFEVESSRFSKQDGTRHHTGTNTVEELQEGGAGDGWVLNRLDAAPKLP